MWFWIFANNISDPSDILYFNFFMKSDALWYLTLFVFWLVVFTSLGFTIINKTWKSKIAYIVSGIAFLFFMISQFQYIFNWIS
jgi:hypothetical protein